MSMQLIISDMINPLSLSLSLSLSSLQIFFEEGESRAYVLLLETSCAWRLT